MTRNNAYVLILLAGLCLTTAGCKTVYVGPGWEDQAVYSWGSLKAVEDKPIAITNAAVLKSMDELGLTVTMKTADSLAAQVVARDSQDQKIAVNLTALADDSTKIAISAGAGGNESKSRLIYKQIQNNLKK